MRMLLLDSCPAGGSLEHLRRLDAGVLLFNQAPFEGVSYLTTHGVISESPAEIARFLATNPNLDKHKIGQFLGKESQLSLAVLDKYAQIFDYPPELPVDEALRVFLGGFALAGVESQMIYRVLERFAFYFETQRTEFKGGGGLYLAYAVMLLNVDLHSEKVKAKMTKEQFIRNTRRESGEKYPVQMLEEMYERILTREIKAEENSATRTLYTRLARINKKSDTTSELNTDQLRRGDVFVKYGRAGKPKNRRISVQSDRLFWADAASSAAGSPGSRSVGLEEIRELTVGNRGTENFRRFEISSNSHRCFSLVTEQRSIDLQAPPGVDLEGWLHFFHKQLIENERKWAQAAQDTEEEASEEAWREIVLNWTQHWNCAMRPGFFHDQDDLLADDDSFGKIFPVSEFVLDRGQRLETAVSVQLVGLWLRGIPYSVRTKVWPLAVGNTGRITGNLVHSLKISAEREAMVSEQLKDELRSEGLQSLAVEVAKSGAGWSSEAEILDKASELVMLFLQLRPDVKFVEDSMVRLALVVLGGVGTSEAAAEIFLNLMLSGYFLDFFTMRWGYMRMRFDFFEKIFSERLPHLFEHFGLLNITTEMYFRPWLLSGFSKVLSLRNLLRVWDGVVLLGEAHFFSVALALLSILEHSLMTQGFGGCLDALMSRKFIDANKFFRLIALQPVSTARHAAWLSAQVLAEQKQTLYDLLLV